MLPGTGGNRSDRRGSGDLLKNKVETCGRGENTPTQAFEILLEVLDDLTKEKGKDIHSLASINTRLAERKIDYAALGYKRLKDLSFRQPSGITSMCTLRKAGTGCVEKIKSHKGK
jgi:hypothetical protein